MSFSQRSIGKIGDFLPTVNPENLEEDLLRIREAAKEYYARKAGTWKPKRDLDAESLEDEARFRREDGYIPWMVEPRILRYFSGPKTITRSVVPNPEAIERIRKAFEYLDTSDLKKRVREALDKKIKPDPAGRIIIDELPTSRRIPDIPELKERFSKYLYGDRIDSAPKIGAGKNPMAEHTIRAVKKSHAKRRFSKKSRHGIL